jgi:hypothetical protein
MTRTWESFIDALPREPVRRLDEEHVARSAENLSRFAGSAKSALLPQVVAPLLLPHEEER